MESGSTVDDTEWVDALLSPRGQGYPFAIDAFRKHCLLNGLDEIGLTLQHADQIRAFEAKRRAEQPWLFG